jgi:predicted nucleotidyltransferase
MRLDPAQIQAIKETIAEADAQAEVFLFGSRTDDSRRGGDIDLLVMSSRIDFNGRLKLKLRLLDLLGAQKIDLVVARDETRPFVQIARKQGIRL